VKLFEMGNSERFLVHRYAPGFIQVGDTVYHSSILLGPQQIVPNWPPICVAELTEAHLNQALALDPDVLLLGTGATQVFPDPVLYASLIARRIGVEVMNTPAACRTYNILVAEGRSVVAALMMIA
jgi:uncharacterized protein